MCAFMCTSVSRFIVATICQNHTLFNQYSMGIPHFLIRFSVDGLLVCCFGFHKKSSHNSYPSFYVAVFSHCLCLWIGLWSHDHFLNSNFFEQCSMKPENTLSFILVLAHSILWTSQVIGFLTHKNTRMDIKPWLKSLF